MDERLRFVARRLDGEKMAPLCREFGAIAVCGCDDDRRILGIVGA